MLCPALPTAFTPGYGSDYPDTPLGLFQASPAPRAQFLRECRGPPPFPMEAFAWDLRVPGACLAEPQIQCC